MFYLKAKEIGGAGVDGCTEVTGKDMVGVASTSIEFADAAAGVGAVVRAIGVILIGSAGLAMKGLYPETGRVELVA